MTTPDPMPAAVAAWHAYVAAPEPSRLEDLLADDVVFRSPAVHTPQEGKALTTAYLTAAAQVLGPGLTYHRQLFGDDSAMLEFTTVVGGKDIHGIDLLRWAKDDRLVEFTVMIRPMQGLTAVIEEMAAALRRG